MNTKLIAIFLIINALSFHMKALSQVVKYDYENWPGKNSVSKNNIKINDNLVSNYKMKLAKGYNDSSLFYRIPLNENDSIKKGRLHIKIFSNSSEAQMALTAYLDCIVTPKSFPRLTSEKFKHGDVAFGSEHNGIIQMAYTKNNVLVILHAPTEKALLLCNEIDLIIQNAPELRSTIKPTLLFTK